MARWIRVSVGIKGGEMGSISAMIPLYTIPIRARAYNDCAKDAVLLKTASNGGIQGPKMGSHFGS